MTVHKKHPADASAFVKTTADKEAVVGKEEKQVEAKSEQVKAEPVVVSDIITKTTEKIETIEEADPLTDFKEKMAEEEQPLSDNLPEKNYMWPILLIFIIIILFLIGIFLYKSGGINIQDKPSVSVATPSPVPTAIPEPTKAIDLTKYEIEIQNGSGISGEAGRQKANLESEGFTVSATANADNSDYTDTIIKAKKEVEKDFIDKLSSFLEIDFILGESETLPDDAVTPVVVILGTKK